MERKNNKCFIISPIGDEGSHIRRHSDDVYDYIIKPAMEELGVKAYRSDHNHALGKISEQMFDSILYDDFCIAVLTYHNPNVYYELAIAQSSARPVIILIEEGNEIPFDIKDQRIIYYRLGIREFHERKYINEIIEKVKLLLENYKNEVIFAPNLSPLGGTNIRKIYNKAEEFGTSDKWLDLFEEAEKEFLLCGISLNTWVKHREITKIIENKINNNCNINILLMSENNTALSSFLNDKDRQGSINQEKNNILEATTFFNKFTSEGFKIKHALDCAPHQFLAINEKRAIIVTYLYSCSTFKSPLIEVNCDDRLYKIFKNEFKSLWVNSIDIVK